MYIGLAHCTYPTILNDFSCSKRHVSSQKWGSKQPQRLPCARNQWLKLGCCEATRCIKWFSKGTYPPFFCHCALLESPSTQWDISPAADGDATDGDYKITAFGNSDHILRPDSSSELVCSSTRRRVTWTIEPRGKNYVFDPAFHPNFNPFILD